MENAKAICALLRGRWVAGELSYGVRALQRQRKRHQHDPSGFRTPASAPYGSPSARGYLRKRPSGRSIARRAAPFGASCDESPRIRPHLVVAPKGAARRRFGFAFALNNGSILPLSAPKSECDARPNLGAELPLPLGAARRRWRLVVPCSSQRWLCRVPIGGVVSCFAFPQRARLGLPTPPRRARCNECASLVP